MASSVHLRLKIDGRDIEGDSTVSSMGREDTIECLSYRQGVSTPYDAVFRQTGKRLHTAVTITKRIDRSTPFLLRALCQLEAVDKAEFRFYRPDPQGTGTEEQFYTVTLEGGFVASVEQSSDADLVSGEQPLPALETVTFAYQRITWSYEPTGAEHQDTVAGRM